MCHLGVRARYHSDSWGTRAPGSPESTQQHTQHTCRSGALFRFQLAAAAAARPFLWTIIIYNFLIILPLQRGSGSNKGRRHPSLSLSLSLLVGVCLCVSSNEYNVAFPSSREHLLLGSSSLDNDGSCFSSGDFLGANGGQLGYRCPMSDRQNKTGYLTVHIAHTLQNL